MTSQTGQITSWNDEKGFGFITPTSGKKQIFIHANDFCRKKYRPVKGIFVIL